ncbi:AAA family ATPase [Nibricoccus sp. IMCC34717]|uniref:AAA family ATPase n=1 Tax=Nibricoccus sp. IMCC34717 TaxID=3034021 RepID=UPI00384E350A
MGETNAVHRGPRARLVGLEQFLAAEILGQDEAVRTLARAVLRGEYGCVEPGRPRSFTLLLGETGVGKTESVLTLARHLYSNLDTVIRLDMAEYAERGPALARLVGTSASEPGLIADELARARAARDAVPGSGGGGVFLLLDEIEKAHPDVCRLFLGMEAARLTIADGRRLDLADVHLVCTSNLGSESARELSGLAPYAYLRSVVEDEARLHFGSAVFARFSDVIVYRSLDYTTQRRICAQKLARKLAFLSQTTGLTLSAEPSVLDHLVRRGYHRDLGARHMRQVIDRELGDAVVACLSGGAPAQSLSFSVRDGALLLAMSAQECPRPTDGSHQSG